MRSVIRHRGLAALTVALVTTLWLAATGQLVLYIHPRYVVFTVIMTVIGLLFVVAELARRLRGGTDAGAHAHAHAHAHDHDDLHDHADARQDASPLPRGRRALIAGSSTVVLAATASLLLLPPTTLSSLTAGQREVNSAAVRADAASVADAAGATDSVVAGFSVLDWSSLLRQSSDVSFYEAKPVDVTGFITADPDGADDVFYVSRFIITCCAVDAQPVGVPVYLDDWQSTYSEDQWVTTTGEFTVNPSSASTQPIALDPDSLVVVDQPTDPYLY